MTREDAVFVAAMAFTLAVLARHARKGAVSGDTTLTALCICTLMMAGVNPHTEASTPKAHSVWRRFGPWYSEVYTCSSGPHAAHGARSRAEFENALLGPLSGVVWLGEPAAGFAAAAKSCGRGGWAALLEKANRDGILSGFSDAGDELTETLLGEMTTLSNPMYRGAGHSLTHNFGTALDRFRRSKRSSHEVAFEDLEVPASSDSLDGVEQLREQRELLEYRALVESFPREARTSKYAKLIAQHAWELLVESNPNRLAERLGVAPRPLLREWQRLVGRMKSVPELEGFIDRVELARKAPPS